LWAIATLVLLTLAWGWRIASRPDTAIPGTRLDRDVATMVWNVGAVEQALHSGDSLLRTERVLVPFGADLRLHTYGLFPALLVSPIARWAGAVTAFNVLLLATIALNGITAYALFRTLPVRRAAALAAAAALMLSGPVLDQMRVGRPIFASIWIVCAALVLARLLSARPSIGLAAALGAALAAALFTDFQVLLFTCVWLGIFVGWTIWQERRIDGARLFAFGIALAIPAVPFAAIFYPALTGASGMGVAAPSPAEAVVYSYRWWDYLTPSVVPHAMGGYELAAAFVAAFFLVRHELRLRFWLIGAAILLVLALGPTLKFTGLPLPFALLSLWPPFEQFRTPARLTIPAVVGLAAILAVILDLSFQRVRAGVVPVLVGGALILRLGLAWVHHPLHVQEYPRYETYRGLAAENRAAAVIEVPFGVRSGLDRIGEGGEVLQYYQHVHGRPMLNAMIARLPSRVFDFYRSRPSLLFLAGEQVEVAREALSRDFDDVMGLIDADTVLVHRDLIEPGMVARVEQLLDSSTRLTRVRDEADLIVYRTRGAAPQ
jgi:hypothetical protein